MKKILSLSLALLLVVGLFPITTFATEKTVIDEIRISFDYTQPVYGQTIQKLTDSSNPITIEGDLPLSITFSSMDWYKYLDDDWVDMDFGYFSEGIWCHDLRINLSDSENYKFADEGAVLYVNGVEWDKRVKSSGYVKSPSFEIEFVPNAMTLTLFHRLGSYSVPKNYVGTAIEPHNFSYGAMGGVKPYTFSLTGSDWLQISEDGVLTGTPTTVGNNQQIYITVTDAEGSEAYLAVAVGKTFMNPSDRTVISRVVGSINIPEYRCGDKFNNDDLVTTVSEGAPAYIYIASTDFYPVDGEGNVGSAADYAEVGNYVIDFQVRIDGDAGSSYMLVSNDLELVINGETIIVKSVTVNNDNSNTGYIKLTTPFVVEHNFDNETDATCSGCDYTREGCDHTYEDECSEECTKCGEFRVGKHSYYSDCDTDCNVCGKTREPAGDHQFTNCQDNTCNRNYCEYTREPLDCVYTDCFDEDCDVCGYSRVAPAHTYTNILDTECDDCGAPRELEYIKAGETKELSLGEGEHKDYVFECRATGWYEFTSSFVGKDTYGEVFDSNGISMSHDDDSAGNRQFLVYINLTAGKTYVLRTRFYSESYSGEGTVTLTPDFMLLGDINGDTNITVSDALLVVQSVTGKTELTEQQKAVANLDGKEGIALSDALQILHYVVGKVEYFE